MARKSEDETLHFMPLWRGFGEGRPEDRHGLALGIINAGQGWFVGAPGSEPPYFRPLVHEYRETEGTTIQSK